MAHKVNIILPFRFRELVDFVEHSGELCRVSPVEAPNVDSCVQFRLLAKICSCANGILSKRREVRAPIGMSLHGRPLNGLVTKTMIHHDFV